MKASPSKPISPNSNETACRAWQAKTDRILIAEQHTSAKTFLNMGET